MNSEFEIINISSFDGQTVWKDRDNSLFEVGNFLGGGAAGNVYECEHIESHEHYALKILNPIGYKILSSPLLRKCNVLVKGKVFNDNDKAGGVLRLEHIWWLLSSSNKQYIAGYFSERYNSLKELSLNQCIQLWGTEPAGVTLDEVDSSEGGVDLAPLAGAHKTYVPNLPPKYVDFLRRRNRIFREIKNMRKISKHKNVILLESVLELIQESKCTIFLVMELANGGELFDRIKLDCGAREDTANAFFQQLLLGVKHCHDQGVCHRDLKPENLLLQDNSVETVLKIADFGFSARFAMSFTEESANKDQFAPSSYDDPAALSGGDGRGGGVVSGQGNSTLGPATPTSSFMDESPLRVLKSVVGSPFYVAPEVMQAHGYDGCKADVWSLGVILYAMLAGNLPFSQELSICKRFRHFCKWVREETPKVHSFLENVDAIEFPSWLFPARFSNRAKGLIVSMLHPDPDRRISVHEAMLFPLCLNASAAAPAAPATPVAVAVVDNQAQMLVDQVVNVKLDSVAAATAVAPEVPAVMGIAVVASEVSLAGEGEMEVSEDDAEMSYSRVESNEDHQMFAMEEDDVVDVRASHGSSSSSNHAQMVPPSVAKKLSYEQVQQHQANQPQHQQPLGKMQVPSSIVHLTADTPGSKGSLSIPHMPPMAKLGVGPLEDLMNLTFDPTSDDEGQMFDSPISGSAGGGSSCGGRSGDEYSPRARSGNNSGGAHNALPPSFNDLVKRSTRFITAVPPTEVLDKIETILENVKFQRTVTPIGFIGRVELNWDRFCLDVWGLETHGPALCSIYVYQMPVNSGGFGSVSSAGGSFTEGQSTFLVEFVRGQLEIFAFKRFYQWVRQSLCELVKRDYALKFFDQASSPVLNGMYFPKKSAH